MSNYPCSVVHGDGDPVGNQFYKFPFFDSQAAFIQLSVNEGMMLYECAIKL